MTMSPAQRHDGWTPQRRLRFLAALAQGASVTAAAGAAGMSKRSAYKLRASAGGAAFARDWDLAQSPWPEPVADALMAALAQRQRPAAWLVHRLAAQIRKADAPALAAVGHILNNNNN